MAADDGAGNASVYVYARWMNYCWRMIVVEWSVMSLVVSAGLVMVGGLLWVGELTNATRCQKSYFPLIIDSEVVHATLNKVQAREVD